MNSDLDNIFFKINRQELLRNLHVYATNSKEDKEKVEMLKQLLQPAIQNGADLSDAIEILSADSENRIKDVLRKVQDRKDKMEKMKMEQQNRALEMQQQQNQMSIEAQQKMQEEKLMNENMNAQADRETKIQIAEIQALSYERNEIVNTADITKAADNALNVSKQNFEKMIRMKELQQEDRRMDIDEQQLKSREDIAKMKNKNTKKKK